MMNSYPINSIDKKYCKFSDVQLLEALETCSQCKNIPLPTYKFTHTAFIFSKML